MNVIIVDEDCTIKFDCTGTKRMSESRAAKSQCYDLCLCCHTSFLLTHYVSLSLSPLYLSPFYHFYIYHLYLSPLCLSTLYDFSLNWIGNNPGRKTYTVSLVSPCISLPCITPVPLCYTDLLYLPRELRSSSISAWCCSSKVSIDFG